MWVQVVEDDPIMRHFFDVALQRLGYRVALFGDAEAALREHKTRQFPVVILDWLLPGMDGLQLCQRLRELPGGEDLVILIVTSRARPEDLDPVMQAGADDYLAKPISGALLRTRLRIAERTATERRKRRDTEAALRRRELEVQYLARMEALGRLAGGISHDFNNLLTAIRGYSGMLVETLERDDPVRDDLLEIDAAARRAADLTRQLLAFSRGRVGEPKSINLAASLGQSERFLQRLLGTDVEIVTGSASGEHWVKADPGQVDQILINLAINARDAMPGGGQLHMQVDEVAVDNRDHTHPVLPPGRYVRLVVRDNGCGMDVSTRARIFEPFFSTKTGSGGSGLGLSIVYGIVTQHGGYIDVQSELEVGTTFSVLLPCASPDEHATEPLQVPQTRSGGANLRVLLVEDDAPIRRLAARLLAKRGFEVVRASNGKDALQRIGDQEVDLMVSDVVMPEMNGVDLAKRMLERDPSLRILFMSGYPTEGVSELLRDGRVEYLQKPFTPDHLLYRIDRLLR